MNDDSKIKKIKELLSGSLNLAKEEKNIELENDFSKEELANNFLKQIFDSAWVEDELAAQINPSYSLSKNKSSYFLINQQTKTLTHIKSGIEIVPIEEGVKNTTCLIGNCLYTIPNNIIICNGWN